MAIIIHNADDATPVDLDGLKSGGQVIVLETSTDVVNHYREVLERYHRHLNENTDIFDRVMVEVTLMDDDRNALKLPADAITDLVMHHLADEGLPTVIDDTLNPPMWVSVSPDNKTEPIVEAFDVYAFARTPHPEVLETKPPQVN